VQASILSFLSSDSECPSVPIESLAGWDNYQTYSLFCVDRPSKRTIKEVYPGCFVQGYPIPSQTLRNINDVNDMPEGLFESFLAVQSYAPTRIDVDFTNLIQLYFEHPPRIVRTGSWIDSISVIAADIEATNYLTDFLPSPAYKAAVLAAKAYILANGGRMVEKMCAFYATGNPKTTIWIENYDLVLMPYLPPDYMSLLDGYLLDNRIKPSDYPQIVAPASGEITISYYRENKLEPIPKLRSIDWFTYRLNLIEGNTYNLPIENPVFGTVKINGSIAGSVIGLISSIPSLPGTYAWIDFIYQSGALSGLFNYWQSLYNAELASVNTLMNAHPDFYGTDGSFATEHNVNLLESETIISYLPNKLRCLAANNDFANNSIQSYSDINFDINHPMFAIDSDRAYDWHVKPVLEGIGDLIVDSTKIQKMFEIFNCGLYDVDPVTGDPPVANLGHLIIKASALLGYRPKLDGTVDHDAERKNTKQIIPNGETVDIDKVGVNTFGPEGMVLLRLNNRFDGDKIVRDECVHIEDIPQLLGEYQDQLNLALGIQESSAVEMKNQNGTARYNNQLEMITELVNIVRSTQEMIQAILVSSLVTQGQTSEIIGGIGLPSVTKTLPVKINNQSQEIPYKGISPHRSLSQEIATCTYNVGIVTGALL
jgi:hypothetical protein